MTRTPSPVYRELASTFQAYLNCAARNDDTAQEWQRNHHASIVKICEEFLPSGSGIDNGTKFDFENSKPDKLVLTFGYHHMNEGGYYDGWTDHSIAIRPSLAHAFNTMISGRDRNQIKDYLYDVYQEALCALIYQDEEGDWLAHYATPTAPQA